MPLFHSSSSPAPFTVSFPAEHLIHGPSSVVAGSVTVDPDACRKDGIETVEVSVICKQTSVYFMFYGSHSQDYRKEIRTLYSESTALWSDAEGGPAGDRALVAPIDTLAAHKSGASPAYSAMETASDGGILNRVRSRMSSKGKSKEPGQPAESAGSMTLPFAMQLPAGPNDLPPTFEAGNLAGKTASNEMGFTRWAVKVVGRRKGFLKSDRKTLLVFACLPSYSTPPTAVPPPLLPRMGGSPAPCPTQKDGWRTVGVVRPRREGVFRKKGLLVAKLALPDLPSYPSPLEIPFHLTILHLSPPLDSNGPSSSSPPAGPKSSFRPEDLKVQLVRNVWTRAHGGEQMAEQICVNDAIVLSTRHVWRGEPRIFDQSAWAGLETSSQNRRRQKEGQMASDSRDRADKKGADESDDEEDEADLNAHGIRRAGHETIVTGSLRFPVGPTFEAGTNPKSNLACTYILRLTVPLSRAFSSTTPMTLVDANPGLKLSSTLPDGQGVTPTVALELDPQLATRTGAGPAAAADELAGLPGYFEVVRTLKGDWGEDEKR